MRLSTSTEDQNGSEAIELSWQPFLQACFTAHAKEFGDNLVSWGSTMENHSAKM